MATIRSHWILINFKRRNPPHLVVDISDSCLPQSGVAFKVRDDDDATNFGEVLSLTHDEASRLGAWLTRVTKSRKRNPKGEKA